MPALHCHCEEPTGRRFAPPEDRLRDAAIPPIYSLPPYLRSLGRREKAALELGNCWPGLAIRRILSTNAGGLKQT
jgi:hypothetical protein